MTSLCEHQILLWTKTNFIAKRRHMDSKGKPKSPTVSDKINTLDQVDAHAGTHVKQASWSKPSMPTLNRNVKNYE
jgi:hypothetical protein